MSYAPISTAPIQYSKASGEPANGYYLKFYVANSSTPITMQTDSGGATSLAKCKLNESGYPISNPLDENTIFIPHLSTSYDAYRFVLYASAEDADANGTNGLPNIPSIQTPWDAARDFLNGVISSADIPFIQSGTGAVATTVQEVLRREISIFDFLTESEKTDITTRTASIDISAKITTANASLPNGGTIFFPAGKYRCESGVSVGKNITWIGDGENSSSNVDYSITEIYKTTSVSGPCVTLSGVNAKIKSLGVNCQIGNTGDAILITGSRCGLTDVGAFNAGQDGIRIGTDAGTNANGWILTNVKSKANLRHGLNISDKVHPTDPDANGGVMIGGDIQFNGVHGIYLGHTWLNTIQVGMSQNNGGSGLYIENRSYNNLIVGGDYEANTVNDIYAGPQAFANTIISALAYSSPKISINNTDCSVIFNNYQLVPGGVSFKSTVSGATPSLDPNTLDDYEEGTWTPTLNTTVSGSFTLVSPTNSMRYLKVGKTIYIEGYLEVSAVSAPVGNLRIGGLPFAPSSTTFSAISFWCDNILTTNAFTAVQGFVANGYVQVRGLNNGTELAATFTANVQVGSKLIIGGWYTADN